jgi:hypothetical protein
MPMNIKSVLLMLIFLFGAFARQGFSQEINHYQEVKSKVSFPIGFDDKKSKEIIASVAIEKLNLIKKGKMVDDKNWDNYLNAIAGKLLQNEPALLQKIKVSIVKDLSANAVSYIDGSIFLNLGLIIHLKSESELAFIIAHEIVHVMKQHALKEIEQQNKINQAEINTNNNFGRSYRNLIHSKENEYEADGIALKLVIQAGYNPSLALKALHLLNPDSSLYARINMAQVLGNEVNNSLAQLDSSEWIKSKKRNEKVILKIELNDNDQFSTHPDVAKRIISLEEQLKVYELPEKMQLFQIKDSLNYIQMQQQLVKLALSNAIDDFEYQFAMMLVLTNKFQFEDELRKTTLLKSLYFIAQSKENQYEDELLSKCAITTDSNMVDLNKILYSYDTDKFKKLVYGFAKKLVEQGQNEDNYFYYALCNEAYLGKQTSQIIFQNLLNKFPNGKYAIVAKQKLTDNDKK